MSNLPSNLPALLRAAGLTVIEIDGWQTRGRPASTGPFNPVGVLNHHTGSSAKGWDLTRERAYAKSLFLTGRPDLPPPLCHMSLARSGTVYLGAAGRANHAGVAKPSGSVTGGDGNTLYAGIEWMLSGTEEIPVAMMTAGVILNAVLTEQVTKTSVQTISCHYQTSVTGKWDIGDPNGIPFNDKKVLDVDKFRKMVSDERDRLFHTEPTPPPVVKRPSILGLSWNLRVGRVVATVRRELSSLIRANGKPPFVSVQEARGYRLVIALLARVLGYAVFQPKDVAPKPKGVKIREAGSTALLLRKDIKVREHGVLRGSKVWSGPKHGLAHEGRVLPWVTAQIDGKWTLLMAVHMPTGKNNPVNVPAWNEMLAQISALVAAVGLPFILVGDWNDPWMSRDPRSPRALASRAGGELVHTDAAIDYALVGGHKTVVTKAAERGSDHFAIRVKKG